MKKKEYCTPLMQSFGFVIERGFAYSEEKDYLDGIERPYIYGEEPDPFI